MASNETIVTIAGFAILITIIIRRVYLLLNKKNDEDE